MDMYAMTFNYQLSLSILKELMNFCVFFSLRSKDYIRTRVINSFMVFENVKSYIAWKFIRVWVSPYIVSWFWTWCVDHFNIVSERVSWNVNAQPSYVRGHVENDLYGFGPLHQYSIRFKYIWCSHHFIIYVHKKSDLCGFMPQLKKRYVKIWLSHILSAFTFFLLCFIRSRVHFFLPFSFDDFKKDLGFHCCNLHSWKKSNNKEENNNNYYFSRS